MITAAERRAKIEKLKRDRELKEQEKQRQAAQAQATAAGQKSSNDLIDQILKKTENSKNTQLMNQAYPGGASGDPDTGA